MVNSKTVSSRIQLIVSGALLLAGLGGGAQAGALPLDGKQAADAQAAQAPASGGSPVTLPPKITYEGGQLTIIAENSMLSDVMNTLRSVLGADIDLPASAASERVWVRLGPGPARKVLSDLLGGTDLNFVIQGSATNAGGIRSILLTPHTEATPAGPGGNVPDPSERMANRRFQGRRETAEEPPQQETPAPPEPPAASTAPPAAEVPPTPPTTPSTPVAGVQPAAAEPSAATVGEMVAHPSPPESMNQQSISQQLLSMYQQRRQLNQQAAPQTPQTSSPTR